MARKVYKCDKVTMKILDRYDSARAAERAEGVKYGYLHCALRTRAVGTKPYVFRYASDYDPFESFEGKYGRPILVLDVVDGKTYTFNTIDEAAKELLIAPSTVTTCLSRKIRALGCYKIEYAR